MYVKNFGFKISRRLVGLLVSVVVLIVLSSNQPVAQPILAAPASETWTTCVPVEVMTYVEGRRVRRPRRSGARTLGADPPARRSLRWI